MLSNYGLDKETYSDRKVVKESKTTPRWNKVTKEIGLINKYHYTPVGLRKGYRTGNNIIRSAKWILIDVDEPGDNVETKLREYKLHFIKAPSGSATDEVTHKWHYFVKTKRLSENVAIARAQLQDFYTALGLVNVDTSAIDPARYFAPCGCAEIFGTDEWRTRVQWCNDNTVVVKGNKWVPVDEEDLDPIYSGNGNPINIKNLDTADAPEMDKHGDYKIIGITNPETGSFRIDPDNKIYTKDGWTTHGEISARMSEGDVVSNLFGCPVHNMEHADPKKIGYGYAQKGEYITYFNCGGKSCRGKSYYLLNPKDKK